MKSLQRLALYLVSNVGNLITGNRLESLLGIGTISTIMKYFSEKSECDFVNFETESAQMVVQVCYELAPDNLDRELNGLFEVLDFFD